MGFYLRKSLSVGPFRFNLSKSGVGLSAGVKGFRIGTGPRGNYVHMGRGGLYFRQTIPSSNARITPAALTQENAGVALNEIESGNVGQMVDSSSAALLQEINFKSKRLLLWPWALSTGPVLLITAAAAGAPVWTLILIVLLSAGGFAWALHADKLRKTVVLFYELEPQIEKAFQQLHDACRMLKSSGGVWHIGASGSVSTLYDWKVNAGAHTIVKRTSVCVQVGSPPYFQCNVAIPVVPAGRQRLYFLPDRILVWDNSGVGAVSFDQVTVSFSQEKFIETGPVPRDAYVIDTTWRYVNKDGSPDRRFNDNRKIPVALYENIFLTSSTGLREAFQVSNRGVGYALKAAIQEMAKANNGNGEPTVESNGAPDVNNFNNQQPSQMKNAPSPLAFAVQSAVVELLETIETLGSDKEQQEALRDEAERTVLRLIAAIILADGEYQDGERALVSLLVDWTAKPGGEARYLNEYAAKWAETCSTIPEFFKAAVHYDKSNGTRLARDILRNIQLIGNNVCACNSRFAAAERSISQNFVVVLETYHDEPD